MTRISQYRRLGFSPSAGPHMGIGTNTNFVLSILFASHEDKAAYVQDRYYQKLLKKLKKYSTKDGLLVH